MNENPEDEVVSIAENARQKIQEAAGSAQDGALDALSSAETYIRKNPWIAVGGAIAAGIVIAALLPRREKSPDRLQAVRDWLEDAYEKVGERLPDKADVQEAARSLHLPPALSALGKKLNFWNS